MFLILHTGASREMSKCDSSLFMVVIFRDALTQVIHHLITTILPVRTYELLYSIKEFIPRHVLSSSKELMKCDCMFKVVHKYRFMVPCSSYRS